MPTSRRTAPPGDAGGAEFQIDGAAVEEAILSGDLLDHARWHRSVRRQRHHRLALAFLWIYTAVIALVFVGLWFVRPLARHATGESSGP